MMKKIDDSKKLSIGFIGSAKSFLLVLWFVVILLSVGQLVLSNEISTHGEEIIKLEKQKLNLEQEVALLRQDVLRLGSLTRIREEAIELGFSTNLSALEFISVPKLAQAQ